MLYWVYMALPHYHGDMPHQVPWDFVVTKTTQRPDVLRWLPSGKRLQKAMENHHAIYGKIHYFHGHVQSLC